MNITFDKKWKTYHIDGKRVPSISKVLRSITPPFDAPVIARKVAQKKFMHEPQILEEIARLIAEWDAGRAAGLKRGCALHEHIAVQMGIAENPQAVTPLTRDTV